MRNTVYHESYRARSPYFVTERLNITAANLYLIYQQPPPNFTEMEQGPGKS